jgi:hypothetical protein
LLAVLAEAVLPFVGKLEPPSLPPQPITAAAAPIQAK